MQNSSCFPCQSLWERVRVHAKFSKDFLKLSDFLVSWDLSSFSSSVGGAELGNATGGRDDHPDDAGIGGHAGSGIVSRSSSGSISGDAARSDCYHGTQQVRERGEGKKAAHECFLLGFHSDSKKTLSAVPQRLFLSKFLVQRAYRRLQDSFQFPL